MPILETLANGGVQLGMQAGSQLIGGLMGGLFADANDRRQLAQQAKLQALQEEGNKRMVDYNMQKQLKMWEATNYSRQVEELTKAGLNPAYMYGKGGGGGVTTGSATGNVQGASAPVGGGERTAMALGTAQQMMGIQLMKAQRDNINADTANKQADTENKPLLGDNIKADTAVKIAEQVIKDYTGRDLKLTFERVTKPNIGIRQKTEEDEMSARQAIATTIYDRWVDGTLEGKSLADMEAPALANAKTKAETENIKKTFEKLDEELKGLKLNNIILDLESKLQTETGIDKNSPAWMKILGRLFVTIMGGK